MKKNNNHKNEDNFPKYLDDVVTMLKKYFTEYLMKNYSEISSLKKWSQGFHH